MGKQKAPTPPDPRETASAQTGSNVTTALANAHLGNVSQITPDGSVRFTSNGSRTFRDPTNGARYSIPNYTRTVSLSPAQQRIKNQADLSKFNLAKLGNYLSKDLGSNLSSHSGRRFPGSSSERLTGSLGEGLSESLGQERLRLSGSLGEGLSESLSNRPTENFRIDNASTEARLMDLGRKRLDPALAARRSSLDSRLANQGIHAGSKAYETAQRQNYESENDAYNQLLLTGRGQAANEQLAEDNQRLAADSQYFNQSLAEDNQRINHINTQLNEDSLRFGQSIAEDNQRINHINTRLNEDSLRFNQGIAASNQGLHEDNQRINQISALLNGGQVSQPIFGQTNQPQIPTVDYAGLVNQNYNQQLANVQQNNSRLGGLAGGLFSLGRAAFI